MIATFNKRHGLTYTLIWSLNYLLFFIKLIIAQGLAIKKNMDWQYPQRQF